MKKREIISVGVVVTVVLAIVFYGGLVNEPVNEPVSAPVEKSVEKSVNVPVSAPVDKGPVVINWDKYNYDYVDENVKGILSSMIGGKRVAFYLPSTGYINVSSGSKFGVAYALNNPNPSGNGVNWEQYNSFNFSWNVDPSVVENCGVSVVEAQKWIERGWSSWGKMAQGWIDHMTIYFNFPEGVTCNVKYNFLIEKDGEFYADKQIEFNLI